MISTIERNTCAENEILEMEKLIRDFERQPTDYWTKSPQPYKEQK